MLRTSVLRSRGGCVANVSKELFPFVGVGCRGGVERRGQLWGARAQSVKFLNGVGGGAKCWGGQHKFGAVGSLFPERTTEEFLLEMTVTGKLSGVHKELVGNFLEHCDMVKFAAYGPDSREIESSFNSAKKLVDETKVVFQENVVEDANVN